MFICTIIISIIKLIMENYNRLMLYIKPNKNYIYTYQKLNGPVFIIISYLILDTTFPRLTVLIVNILILREIRKLPLSLQVKR